MAKQSIGLGSSANDGNGDTLRAAGTKINSNTDEIYARFGSGTDLETATSANILVGNGTKFASVATSGDFNISSAGEINVRTSGAVSKITIPSGSAPGTTTNALYNIGGALYFNGSVVGSGNVTGMTAFSVASGGTGSSGSAQSITQGDTVTIAGGTGITSAASATDTITLNIDDATVATLTGTQTLENKTLTSPSVSGLTLSDASIVLEGATADDFETTLTVTDPTADRTITFPDATGTVALTSDITVTASSTTAFTNKTIDANGTGNSITNLEVADFAAASVVTQSEGIGSNNNDTTIPTSAAVKAYADSVGGGSSTLAGLSDTAISSAAAGNVLLYDGSNSFDNKVVKSNDITLAHTAALAIPMGGFTFGPISASGTDHYVFANYTSGGADSNDPHLYLLSDMAYIFDLSGLGGAHPFQIESGGSALTTSNGADGLIHIATDGTVTTGTSANAKTSGLLIWKIPHFTTASTGTYTYQCTSHTNMQGSITIKTLETLS